MKIKKEDIPVVMEAPGAVMRNISGFGNMTIAFNEFPSGTDIAPLLKGLKNDSCQCPHWGYLLAGEMIMRYDDGIEETLSEGDVFYMQPGHTVLVTKDIKLIDFSPTDELNEVLTHIGKKMAELSS